MVPLHMSQWLEIFLRARDFLEKIVVQDLLTLFEPPPISTSMLLPTWFSLILFQFLPLVGSVPQEAPSYSPNFILFPSSFDLQVHQMDTSHV
jgi:hypothetical protein